MSNLLKRALDIIKSENVGRIISTVFWSLVLVLSILYSWYALEELSSAIPNIALLSIFILLNVIILVAATRGKSPRYNERYKKLSVVGVILKKQSKWRNSQFVLLSIITIFYMLSSFATGYEISVPVSLFTLGLYTLLYIRLYLLEQRVRSGTYGTTEDDAREIISFILRNPSLMGGDGGKGRPIITAADMREMAEAAISDVIRPEVAC